MTTAKKALTFELALSKIAVQVGWERIAEICERDVSTCYNWSNPNTQQCVPISFGPRLDIAFQEAGGFGAPLGEAYLAQIAALEREQFGSKHELAALTAEAARESGEAIQALIVASLPGAGQIAEADAEREVEEAMAAFARSLRRLVHRRNPEGDTS